MRSLKWIKLDANFFENRQIKYLRGKKNGNTFVMIWIMLLTLAGRCNDNGLIYITETTPYTPKELAEEFSFTQKAIENALNEFDKLGLITLTDDGIMKIIDWESDQVTFTKREYDKLAKRRERSRRKGFEDFSDKEKGENVNDMSMTCQKCQTADKDKDKDKDIDIDGDGDGDGDGDIEKVCDTVATAFNTATTAFGKIKFLSKKQKDAVYNAYKRFGTERLEELFKTAELSRFLKGENKQGWVANFDWLIDINNIPKVLNGNYNELFTAKSDLSGGIGPPDSDKALSGAIRRGVGDIDGEKRPNSSFDLDEFIEAALKRGFDD